MAGDVNYIMNTQTSFTVMNISQFLTDVQNVHKKRSDKLRTTTNPNQERVLENRCRKREVGKVFQNRLPNAFSSAVNRKVPFQYLRRIRFVEFTPRSTDLGYSDN